MRGIILLLILFFSSVVSGQAIVGDVLRLTPKSLPIFCGTGDIRFNTATNQTEFCIVNVWTPFLSNLSVANLTDVGTDGIVVTGGTGAVIGSGTSIAQQAATTSLNGYLKATDWTIFNAKQPAGNYIVTLTGDVSATGPPGGGSASSSLIATSNATLTTLSGLTTASSLATVGTIGTGTWNGSTIAVNHGGTGQTSLTNHGVLVGASTSAITQLGAASIGTVLSGQGASSDPSFSATPVLGASGTTGTLGLSGTSSGTVTIQPQSAAGTYNFNLPITAGSNTQVLTSAGGGSSPMTWSSVPTVPTVTSQSSTLNPAAINTYYVLSGASFTVTLPDATTSGYSGQWIVLKHNGTSLSQLYTLNTTSAQTIGGIASGSYILYTNGETLSLFSDGSNWQIQSHTTNTGVITGSSFAFSALSAYTFTIPSSSITLGTVYTNNGCTFTVSATTASSTTLTASGTCNPAVSGTLTFVSGSPSGNLAFSARTITGAPALGTTTTNYVNWSRSGHFVTITYALVQTGAGTAGSGDYVFYFPTGLILDTTSIAPNQAAATMSSSNQVSLIPVTGVADSSGAAFSLWVGIYAYSSSSFRISDLYENGGTIGGGNIGSTSYAFSTASIVYNFTIVAPMASWQP